jgi:diamine oxidase
MVMKLAGTVLFFTLLQIGGVSAGVEFAGEPKDEIFNTLSASEIDSLIAYLKAEGVVDFNRWEVDDEDKSLNSNYAMVYSAMAPPKAEALAYLDADGPMPERFAAVTVNRGGATTRDVMDYKVGPLVNGTLTEMASYETMYEDGMIPWAKRASTPIDWNWLEDSVAFNAFVLQDLFKNVTGGFCYGSDEDYEEGDCGYDDVTYWEYASLSATTELRDTAVHFWLIPDGTDWGYLTLHPVPISWNFIEDPEKPQTEWVSYNFEYCYQGPYDSAEDLLAAFNAGELTMCYVPSTDLGYSRTVRACAHVIFLVRVLLWCSLSHPVLLAGSD